MHIPIVRKGTKYVARSLAHKKKSVPVVVAVRDMLKLAHTAKEVHEMIKQKSLKINGRTVYDYHDSIKPFNIFVADKTYILSFTSNGRFIFKPSSSSDRPVKIINKHLLSKNTLQYNCSDGSNFVSKEKINIHDTVYLDSQNKVKKHVPLEKGKPAIVVSGSSIGQEGTIESIENGFLKIKFKQTEESRMLKKTGVMVL